MIPTASKRCPDMLIAGLTVVELLAVLALAVLLSGCSFSMTVGTGNRKAITYTENQNIPETIQAGATLTKEAANLAKEIKTP
jgi:hypothetical protein